MDALNLEQYNTKEKIIIMEEIWAELSKNINEEALTPSWHLDILEDRSEKKDFLDLEDVKKDLYKDL